MTGPNFNPSPSQQQGRMPGYNESIAAANGGQAPQHPTQLGQGAQADLPPGLMFDQSVSPLANVQPNVSQQGLPRVMQQQAQNPQFQQPVNPQQQAQLQGNLPVQQPTAQYQLGQQYAYQQPGQQSQQQVDPLDIPNHDPRLPPELRGKTMRQLVLMNQGLRQIHMQSLAGQGQAPVQQQVPGSQVAQGGLAPSAGQTPGQQTQWNWQNPQASIGAVVDEKLQAMEARIGQMLQPAVAQGQATQIQGARNLAAANIPNFVQLEPYIMQELKGLGVEDLTKQSTWELGARLAMGTLAMSAGRQPQPQNPQYQGQFPAQQIQQGGQPVPNLNGYQFFSEQSGQGGQGAQGVQLTPVQKAAAQAMFMSEAEYVAWSGGVPNNAISGGRR